GAGRAGLPFQAQGGTARGAARLSAALGAGLAARDPGLLREPQRPVTAACAVRDPRLTVGAISKGTGMRLVETNRSRDAVAAAEWQARVDLAAAHRPPVSDGFRGGSLNHFHL